VTTELSLGATYLGEGRCQFLVWAPLVQKVEVHLMGPRDRIFPLQPGARGYYHGIVEGVAPGSLYRYRLDGER